MARILNKLAAQPKPLLKRLELDKQPERPLLQRLFSRLPQRRAGERYAFGFTPLGFLAWEARPLLASISLWKHPLVAPTTWLNRPPLDGLATPNRPLLNQMDSHRMPGVVTALLLLGICLNYLLSLPGAEPNTVNEQLAEAEPEIITVEAESAADESVSSESTDVTTDAALTPQEEAEVVAATIEQQTTTAVDKAVAANLMGSKTAAKKNVETPAPTARAIEEAGPAIATAASKPAEKPALVAAAQPVAPAESAAKAAKPVMPAKTAEPVAKKAQPTKATETPATASQDRVTTPEAKVTAITVEPAVVEAKPAEPAPETTAPPEAPPAETKAASVEITAEEVPRIPEPTAQPELVASAESATTASNEENQPAPLAAPEPVAAMNETSVQTDEPPSEAAPEAAEPKVQETVSLPADAPPAKPESAPQVSATMTQNPRSLTAERSQAILNEAKSVYLKGDGLLALQRVSLALSAGHVHADKVAEFEKLEAGLSQLLALYEVASQSSDAKAAALHRATYLDAELAIFPEQRSIYAQRLEQAASVELGAIQ